MEGSAVDPEGHPLLTELHEDELYAAFFDASFDPSRFANTIIQGSSIAKSLEQLSSGISRLEEELHSQVAAHHGDLLQQATGIQHLEDVLKMISNRVASLSGSLERIQEKIQKPYAKIVARTTQLSRLQAACELLRRTLRYVHFLRRLQGQLEGGKREIAKAAHTLTELDALTDVVDLRGIAVVDAEAEWVAAARTRVRDSAEEMLALSVETHNQVQLGTALQVFRSLGVLEPKVTALCEDSLTDVVKGARELLHDRQFTDESVAVAVRRANLWTGMDRLCNLVCTAGVKMRHVERVLAKKRDHTSRQSYLEELAAASRDGVAPVSLFWRDAMRELEAVFAGLDRAAPFIDAAFQNEYPKLLRLFNELAARVAQQGGGGAGVDHQTGGAEDQLVADAARCHAAIAPFERAYLSHSLNRMFDPVQLVFTAGSRTPPSVDEVVNICKTVTKELQVTSADPRLAVPMARIVAKTARLYFVKTEAMVDSAALVKVGESPDPATAANQLRNISLANRLDQLCKGLASIRNSQVGAALGDEAGEIVAAAVADGQRLLETELLDPLFGAVTAHLEGILRQIHYEDYSGDTGSAGGDDGEGDWAARGAKWCAPFLRTFASRVQEVQQQVLARLTCKDTAPRRVRALASRMCEVFVRHACMISRLSESGKSRLSSDAAQLEKALGPLGCNLAECGAPYRALRALRQLLFLATDAVQPSEPTVAAMPAGAVLLHMFARAPGELKPPHTLRGWTLEQFSKWVDTHSDGDVVRLVKEALEVYASTVTVRGDTKFHPVYPVMSALCDAAERA